jgi:aspartate 1-decarboxylase
MKRIVLGSKLHNVTVTESNLDYEGSLALDGNLLKAAGMIPFEQVHVYNVTNGERFSTYLIKAKEGSGTAAVYGAAAHRAAVGDKLIVVSYVLMGDEETEFIVPRIVILDERNGIKEVK